MIIETSAAPPFFKNGFVLACEDSNDAVIVDPGDEVEDLLRFVADRRCAVRYILLTHAHVDHITGVGRAKAAHPVPVVLHRDDLFLYERAPQIGLMFGLRVDPQPPVDSFYEAGQVLAFGNYQVRAHHTPGHCPGGVCLQVGRAGVPGGGTDLFVGDTLFAGSIGRTDLPGGDYDTLIRSITTVLYAFGDDAVVYPGHGPATTIGAERRSNPFLTGA
jgi:glyoxylase-like metal-dependent hydrolase (beta-lactamase superfamily II)